jgi:hypothetical protein
MFSWKALSGEHTNNAVDLFNDPPYDAWTLAAMFEAYATARHELQTAGPHGVSEGMEMKLVTRILKAVAAGECDPGRLTAIALRWSDERGA